MKEELPTNPTPSSEYKSRHKQGDARCGSISFDRAVTLEALTVASEELFHQKGDHSKIH